MKQKTGKEKKQDNLNRHVTMALEKDVDDAVLVHPSKVFTAPWVRWKCQFGCAGYGGSLCCPPRSPTPEQTRAVLDSYTCAMLLHRRLKKGSNRREQFNDVLVELERTIFLDGFYKAFSLGGGPCTHCDNCNTSGSCLHPDKARPSMEACGIDVFATAREQGLPIAVVRNRGEERNIYGLVLIE